jgi:hypothetical protein
MATAETTRRSTVHKGGGMLKRRASQVSINDIAGLVKDLKKATGDEKGKCVHLLDIVAVHDAANPAALVSGGAIKPLVELVANGNDSAQIHASSTLATIAQTKAAYQDQIVAAGGIAPLVQLLRSGSNTAQTYAAAAMASLCEQPVHRDAVVKAGVITPLVSLVKADKTDETKLHAAATIANVSSMSASRSRLPPCSWSRACCLSAAAEPTECMHAHLRRVHARSSI